MLYKLALMAQRSRSTQALTVRSSFRVPNSLVAIPTISLCCPDGTWAYSIGDAKTYSCGGMETKGPFPEACPCCDPTEKPDDCNDAICCEDGEWSCPSDGIYVCNGDKTKDPTIGIICEEVIGTLGCPEELKVCPDGTGVGRDPNNNCEFFPCKDIIEPLACLRDVKACPDSTEVGHDLNRETKYCCKNGK